VYEKFGVKHEGWEKRIQAFRGKSEGQRERERDRGWGDRLIKKTRRRLRIILKWIFKK
jgi:hypothetical protein